MSKKNKGSSLVVTLLVLSIVLISTLSLASVAVKERQASIGSVNSSKAYQLADEGIEKVMQAIVFGNNNYINSGTDSLYEDLGMVDAYCDTSTGLITDNGGNYTVELFDRSDPREPIDCDDSERPVLDIDIIKSIGYDKNTSRAVSAPISFMENGLIAYWRLNEEEGDVAYDWTENGNLGALSGDASFTGDSVDIPDGEYVSVDGLLVDDTEDLKSVTLSAWAKKTGTGGIAGQEVISINNCVGIRINSFENSGLTAGFYYKASGTKDPTDWNFVSSGVEISDNDWHHFVFIADPLNSRQELYIDGVLEGEETFSDNISYDYSADDEQTLLGIAADGSESWNFEGEIREARVYKRALSEDEVLRLYNVSKP